jgi:hypothetical protein
MKSKDQQLLEEAYLNINEGKTNGYEMIDTLISRLIELKDDGVNRLFITTANESSDFGIVHIEQDGETDAARVVVKKLTNEWPTKKFSIFSKQR